MGVVVNAVTVYTSYLLGKYMIEEEQHGSERAKYGAKVLDSLSDYLTSEYGRGFSRSNLAGMRKFYLTYKEREPQIVQSGIVQLGTIIRLNVHMVFSFNRIIHNHLPLFRLEPYFKPFDSDISSIFWAETA